MDADKLSSLFGESKVSVVDCSAASRYDAEEGRVEMKLREFLGLGKSTQYLKDWHFPSEHPGWYEVPEAFRSDWIDEWWRGEEGRGTEWHAGRCDDYRFLYLGRGGSWTPLHHDVFLSNSWSANVAGRKLWIMFPPSAVAGLRAWAARAGVSRGATASAAAAAAAAATIPHDCRSMFKWKAEDNAVLTAEAEAAIEAAGPQTAAAFRFCVVVQSAGEAIFVPSGWYHQVHNLGDEDDWVLSINHNWMNGLSLLPTCECVGGGGSYREWQQ